MPAPRQLQLSPPVSLAHAGPLAVPTTHQALDRWIERWTNGQVNGWTNERVGGGMERRTEGCMYDGQTVVPQYAVPGHVNVLSDFLVSGAERHCGGI